MSARRGSALLVVLGMVAFMVVSAVAFAAWMRASRLPNSFLRRSSASRLLAKAAVAAAIDQIDAAIGNNPHPGIGQEPPRPNAGITTSGSTGTQDTRTRNHWRGRVYIGTNQLHQTSETVSPLCVEALAYIPPPLVNEARYYSRRSDAAIWRRLGFDSGRYAFCALDVSDYFDVNALAANVGRGASPATRVSLAYLCENASHTDYDTQPSAWDTFMKNFRAKSAAEAEIDAGGTSSGGGASGTASADKVPLVSVADLNLALWDKKPGDFTSYFCQYFGGSGGSGSFYGGVTADGPAGEKVKRMTFVTDGYFPPSSETAQADGDDNRDFDLADDECQPFSRSHLKNAGTRLVSVLQYAGTKTFTRLAKGLSRMGVALLWDYLDVDNVPLSLAMPSVERVPMVVGVNHKLNGTIKISASVTTEGNPAEDAYVYKKDEKPPTTAAPGSRTVALVKTFTLDLPSFRAGVFPGVVEATVAYPFRRGIDTDVPGDFKLDGHLALFFASGTMGLRASNATALRLNGGQDLIDETSAKDGSGVFHFKLGEQGLVFSQVAKKEDAVKKVQLVAQENGGLGTLLSKPMLTVVYVWQQTAPPLDPSLSNPTPTWSPAEPPGGSITAAASGFGKLGEVKTHCSIPAVTAAGEVDINFSDDTKLVAYLNGSQETTFTLHAATWLRVRNVDGKTVDLVPAHFADDAAFNSVNNNELSGILGDTCGADFPLMRFAGASFKFSLADLGNVNAPFGFAPAGVMCSDPRWNWAPEHWWQTTDAVTETSWLADCQVGARAGSVVRDSDIFMATSDAGYMQSVYELAMLPRLTDNLAAHNGSELWGDMGALSPALTDWPTSFGDTRNQNLMWRTYCPYKRTGASRDNFENVGVGGNTGRIVCEGGGTKINPYSDSTNVVMAAFANTPTDWWTAAAQAESDVGVEPSVRKNARDFNRKYAFSAMASSEVSKFAWADLQQIAMNYIQKVHASNDASVDWEACFDDLDWDGENSEFCGLDTLALNQGDPKLSDVDRRFLYGFWRECFAARQQLFLVFVRAEPQMLGGGATQQVPPQLGVRAMALVWRDPAATSENEIPHRTRVLFYRQFD